MNASDRELLSALLEHDASGWIPDIHLDGCDDDACTGCEPQHLAERRQARAEEHLAECAAEAGLTPDEYRRRGLALEWQHQILDPAVPPACYPRLAFGSAS